MQEIIACWPVLFFRLTFDLIGKPPSIFHANPVDNNPTVGFDGAMTKITSSTPVADRKLWDSLGNSCRAQLYCIGANSFELYLTDFNSSTPRRFVGGLGELMSRGEIFISDKKAAGFQEQLPSYEPMPIN